MAISAPTTVSRKVVVDNMLDELGCLKEGDSSHEQLFFQFARHLDSDIDKEAVEEQTYRPFLRAFNRGHLATLREADWSKKWALFAAHELLDEVDYNNLDKLANSLSIPECGRTFFKVHAEGDHFGQTYKFLEPIWESEPQTVREAFEFIAKHQLTMWNRLSVEVESAVGVGSTLKDWLCTSFSQTGRMLMESSIWLSVLLILILAAAITLKEWTGHSVGWLFFAPPFIVFPALISWCIVWPLAFCYKMLTLLLR
jgi:hypothetical protein